MLLQGRVKSLQSDIKRQEEVILEARNKLQNTLSLSEVDFSSKLDESEKQLAQLTNQISETRVTLSYQTIVSLQTVSYLIFVRLHLVSSLPVMSHYLRLSHRCSCCSCLYNQPRYWFHQNWSTSKSTCRCLSL